MSMTKEQLRGHVPVPTPEPEPLPDTTVEVEEVPAEPEPEDDGLPKHVTEDSDGSWVYRLQYPLEPTKDDPDGTDVQKIRIPAKTYTRHVLEASRKQPKGLTDAAFHLLVAMTKVPASVMERLDLRDYEALSNARDQLHRRQQDTDSENPG